MSAHTVLPWRITEPSEKKTREIVDANGSTIAKLTALDIPIAEFIVRAVNAHDALVVEVARLKEAGKEIIASEMERTEEVIRLRDANADLVKALKEARRAIGDHFAPNDCYSTGPLTGDLIRDLVECPACSFIKMHDATLAKGGAT